MHLEDVDTESIERDDEEYEMIEEEEMIVAAEVTTEEHALPSLMEELMNAGVMKIEDEEKDDGMVEDEREQGGVENGEQEEDEVKQEEEMERRVEDEDQVVQASVVQIQHQGEKIYYFVFVLHLFYASLT